MRNPWMLATWTAAWMLLAEQPSLAAPGDFQWDRGWDASGFGDLDEDGATGAAGMWFGAINFGGGMQNSANAFTGDVWVAKYGPNGAHQWSRTFTPGGQGVSVTAATCAPNGHIYVAGTIINNGTINFGGGNLAGNNQMWIVKFDEFGNFLWSDTFGLGTIHSLDGDQNLLGIGGDFSGPIDFGGGAINPVGLLDAFLALLQGGAAHVWSGGFGDNLEQITKDVDVDVSGTLVAAGCFQGSIDFGGVSLISNAVPDLFIAQFDPTGAHVWSKGYAGNFGIGADVQASIAQDAGAEHVALAATTLAPVDFGGGSLALLGGSDVALALFDENATHEWSAIYGSAIDDQAHEVAFDLGGNVLASGAFQQMIDFGASGGPLGTNGGVDLFVSSWNIFGAHAWNRSYGTANDDVLCRVVTDPLGNALLFGAADNGIDFGGGALADAEIYLVKIKALNAPVGAPLVAAAPLAGGATFSPNPFVEASSIRFHVPRAQFVSVALHDVTGRTVRSLATGPFAAGPTALAWDGRDDAGRRVPAGVYFWRMTGEDVAATGSVVRLR